MSFLGSVLWWLVKFVFSGLVFVAVVAAAAYWTILTYFTSPIADPDLGKQAKTVLEEDELKLDEKGLSAAPAAVISGWFTVRRQFAPLKDGTHPLGTGSGTSSTVNVNIPEPKEAPKEQGDKQTYVARFGQAYRHVVEIGQSKSNSNIPPRDLFFCVLKGQILYLYQNQSQDDCVAAIDAQRHTVDMEDKNGSFEGLEGKMFAKRHAMVLRLASGHKHGGSKKGFASMTPGMSDGTSSSETLEAEKAPWFFFSRTNNKKEDWYFALLNVSARPPSHSRVFSTSHMKWVADTVQDLPDVGGSGLLWLNALLGRIFLGINHTHNVETYIMRMINKKLALIQHPLIGPLEATEINLGDVPPIVSKPMLKELKEDGTIAFEAHLEYHQPKDLPDSGVLLTIEATKLGFKAVLAVKVTKLSGNVQVKIKPPPSNRIWWGFITEPDMELNIEPVLGSRTLNWSYILSFIAKKLKEGLAESVVLPNMDDFPFYDTTGLPVRGGIFNGARKRDGRRNQNYTNSSDDKIPDDGHADDTKDRPVNRKAHRKGSVDSRRSTASSMGDSISSHPQTLQRSETVPDVVVNRKLRPPRSSSTMAVPITTPSPSNESAHSAPPEVEVPPTVTSDNPVHPSAVINSSTISSSPSPSSVDLHSANGADMMSDSGAVEPKRVNTSALLNAVKARDKATLQSQVNVAKDSVVNVAKEKWTLFNTKRKAKKDTELEEPPSVPAGVGLDDPVVIAPVPHHRDGRSLQERLNAAAQAAATSPKASSSSHRRISSASTTGGMTTGAELSHSVSGRPTSASPHNSDGLSGPDALSSSPTPTTTQPAGGRSMVVPHVPKRPGVVTSIASDVQSASDSPQAVKEEPEGPAANPVPTSPGRPAVPPPLPPRKATVAAPVMDFATSASAKDSVLPLEMVRGDAAI